MKRFILTTLFVIAFAVCNAQSNHLKFKGIPIEGTQNSFVQKLKAKGFTYKGMDEGIAILEGEFAGIKKCTILVSRFADKDVVQLVAVVFPERDNWADIMSDYNTYKQFLTEKYGNPECSEGFSGREPSDDYLKFRRLLDNECQFLSEFSTEGGRIQLSMMKADYNTASVFLKYIDESNANEVRQQIMDDL